MTQHHYVDVTLLILGAIVIAACLGDLLGRWVTRPGEDE